LSKSPTALVTGKADPAIIEAFSKGHSGLTPAMGWLSSAGEFLVLLFFFHIQSCLCLLFPSSVASVIWLAFSGWAQVSMTWLNLLSVQPRGRTLYRFQDGPEKRTEPIL
jgi:hypothetical protein